MNITNARRLAVACATAATLVLGSSASAQIVFNPASISYTAGNTFITDNVNHLDWYRFDNFNTTVGLSYNQVLASSFFEGWSVASLAQVQGLQAQFGWTADTPTSPGLTDNFFLTDAMSEYLGLTGTFYAPVGIASLVTYSIYGMTSDAFYTGPDYSILTHNVTASLTYNYSHPREGDFFYGDYVEGEFNIQQVDIEDSGTGTWLVRNSAGCRTRDCTTVTPEPASLVLLATGLLGLGFAARRRATSRNHA